MIKAAIFQLSVAHWQLIAVPQKLSLSSPLIQAHAHQLDLNRIYFVTGVPFSNFYPIFFKNFWWGLKKSK